MPKRTGEDRRKSSPKKNAPLAPLDDEAPAETNLDKTLLNMPAAQQERPSHMPPPGHGTRAPKRKMHPRPRSIFKPRTKNRNFLLSVAASTIRLTVLLALCASLAVVGAVVGIAKAFVDTAPTLDLAALDSQDKTSFIYDSNGNLITDYKGTEDRIMVSIDEIPEMLRNAFIAVEDARFYQHNGVDVKRIVGALITNITTGSLQGGSTITQQLIKQTVLSSESSYKRKLQEAYLAMELETRYTKDQILESYLNTIFLGGSYYGVRVAAYGYFGKELDQLTLRECAMLAGLTRSPNYYNPRSNFYTRNTEGSNTPDITNNRTDYVLRQMRENGMISTQEYEAALDRSTATVLETSPASTDMYDYPHYVEYAISDVVDTFLDLNGLEDTSANRYAMENKLRTGGYSVYLCLDTEIQQIVEDTLATWEDYPRLRDPSDKVYQSRNSDGTYTEIEQPQAAACVFDYRTGELKAIVGGRYKPTARKTLNRASDMNMPVGSSIKPLSVYAPAIDLGASPASITYNMPVPISGWKDSNGNDSWPQNYGGGGYAGPQSFRAALRNSYNTATAQVLMTYVGVSRSVEYLHLMGIEDSNINADPFGLALGSSGITPVQLAVAFGTIANKGVYQQPLSFSRILDSNGNVVVDMHQQQDRHQVFKPSTAYLVVDMLKEAVQSGTGTRAKISSQVVAGKTGTNSDNKGVTFAGMTGWYSASVWIGHDNYKALSSKATGGNAAAPLWQSFMEKIHKAKNLESREIIDGTPEDYGLVRVTTCGVSGQLATDACYNDVKGYKTITDYWYEGSVPTSYCSMHKSVSICTDTGLLATEYCPASSVETRGIVLIPRGHPLYNYIDSYGSTIRQYLGEFATLKSTSDIANHICQIHDAYTATQPPSELESIVNDAYNLTLTAYQLVGSSQSISNDTRRQINTAISTVQTLLSLSPIDYTSLQSAADNLRSQLQAAGLM
ncbi:MAG TPA: PBP1A family penicillin-binding protein [Candidatus Ventricola intestinavium]|nr:PBP1A family penicillin-binding protein [Candidatus Ventricola intestinavium]